METLQFIQNYKNKILKLIKNLVRITFLSTSIYFILKGEFKEGIFLGGSMILTFLPEIYTKIFGTRIPEYIKLFFVAFIFSAQFLGTFMGFYGYKYWDVLLHLSSGVLVGFISIVLWASVDKTYSTLKNKKIGLIVSYILGIGIAGSSVWELLEFISDILFGTNAQLGSLNDTMQDIACGTVGSIIFSIYIAIKLCKNKRCSVNEIMDINSDYNENKE